MQYDDCKFYQLKEKTTTSCFDRCFNKFEAEFRNDVQAMMDMVADVAVFAVAMMLCTVLRVKERYRHHQLVK